MTLRAEIEALLVEFDHFAYRGAPLEVAVEKLQEILAKTAPRVLTTEDELNSEEAARALCLIPSDGTGIVGCYDRDDGENQWARVGRDYYFSSAAMIEESSTAAPSYTMVERGIAPEILAPAGRRVLTTLDELNSEEAFEALCIVPEGGPLRTPASSSNGVNYWQEPGVEGEYSSAELLAHFASIGAEPAFTLYEG